MYIWEHPNWPNLVWKSEVLLEPLAGLRHSQGRLLGRMETLGLRLKTEAQLRTLTEDVLKTSEIEGEHLNDDQVRSSVARKLGMNIAGLVPSDRRVDGIVEMMIDATTNADMPLTEARLCAWHRLLFKEEAAHDHGRLRIGHWREDSAGPMQVISGPIGHEYVHYEAPPAKRIPGEIQSFLTWFEAAQTRLDPILISALAHFRFVTIHPFDDGNGRIARAIADLMLTRSEHSPQRFYSMSSQIRAERKAYYDILERSQRVDAGSDMLDVTPWLHWFIHCLGRAIGSADSKLSIVLRKASFWERFAKLATNERQRLMINRLLDGFEGKLTTSKWAKLAKCSQDTAYRDILDLIEKQVLRQNPGGGRNTSYDLSL